MKKKNRSLKGTIINGSLSKDDYTDFIQNIWPVIDPIPGYLSPVEAFFLYQTAKNLRNETRIVDQPRSGNVVEIGSYKGKSSIAIGLGLKKNPNGKFKFYCIDPFFNNTIEKDLKEKFLKNISDAGLDDIIIPVPEYSRDAIKSWQAHEGISMLWIDGNHEYDFVTEDFKLWSRYLVPGGYIAFHDWYLIGVKETILKNILPLHSYIDWVFVNNNLVAAKKCDVSPTRKTLANKKRMYWILKTGSTSLFTAFIYKMYILINEPFGHLITFYRKKISSVEYD